MRRSQPYSDWDCVWDTTLGEMGEAVYVQALRDMLALWRGMPGDTWRDEDVMALMRDWAAERGINLEKQP